MSIKEQIQAEVKEAMKARDAFRTQTLRMLHAAIKNREIEIRPNEISDEEVLAVFKKAAKQRKESIAEFEKAGRTELADKEKAELEILEKYLPAELDRAQVEKIVSEVISALGATSMKDMGGVMKEVGAKTKGAADNKLVSEIVRAKLQG